jgi:hypothetical protein
MTSNQKAKKIQEIMEFYRGLILDACEHEMADEKKWRYLRSRLLKLLSADRGLEHKILVIVLEGDDGHA